MKIDLVWHEAGNKLYFDRFVALAEKSELTVHGFTTFMNNEFKQPKNTDTNYALILYRPFFSFHVFSFRLILTLIKSKSNAIYIHEEPHSLLAFLICFFCYKKKIYLDCAVINKKLNFKGFNLFERFVYYRTSGLFYRNQQVKQILLDRGALPEKMLSMLGNGVSSRTFKPLRTLNDNPTMIRIGYAGRVWESKGINCLLDIQSMENVQVEYCGNVVDQVLHEKILASGANYKGMLGIDGLVSFYSNIDLFILPSIPTSNWSEQFGRVIIESVFCGTPAIGSDTGFIPSLIGENATFPAKDINQIKKLVRRYMNNELRQNLWEQQHTKISQEFSWEAISNKVIEKISDE